MHARASNKEIGKLLKEAQARRWKITGGGTRHYQLLCPNPCECIVVVASSTANQIAHKRSASRLKNQTCWSKTATPSTTQKGA